MKFNSDQISNQFLTHQLIPYIFSDQLFNLISLGTFLLARRRVLLKTYTQNKISPFAKTLLQYEKHSKIKSSVDYLQKAGKYVLVSILGCSIIKFVEKGSEIETKLKIQELFKPIILFKIFQLHLGFGVGLGIVNLGSKLILDQQLKQFM